jgi:hypothetical protein
VVAIHEHSCGSRKNQASGRFWQNGRAEETAELALLWCGRSSTAATLPTQPSAGLLTAGRDRLEVVPLGRGRPRAPCPCMARPSERRFNSGRCSGSGSLDPQSVVVVINYSLDHVIIIRFLHCWCLYVRGHRRRLPLPCTVHACRVTYRVELVRRMDCWYIHARVPDPATTTLTSRSDPVDHTTDPDRSQ